MSKTIGVALSFAVILVLGQNSSANSNGVRGYSGNPATGGAYCTRCHGGGTTPTVKITGPTMVAPGSKNTYIMTISGGQKAGGGLDVSTTGGALSVSTTDVSLDGTEVTHTKPKAADGQGNVTFSFQLTAPATAGTVTLYGAGNSVNLNGSDSGDNAAITNLPITVAAVAPSPSPTPVPSPSPTPKPSPSPTPVPSPSPTPKPSPSPTPVPSPSPTPKPSPSPTPIATPTPTPTPVVANLAVTATVKAPARVRLNGGTASFSVSISGAVTGGIPGQNMCGTAYLSLNGGTAAMMPACAMIDTLGNGTFSVSFPESLTSGGSYSWSGYVKIGTATSNTSTDSTYIRTPKH